MIENNRERIAQYFRDLSIDMHNAYIAESKSFYIE